MAMRCSVIGVKLGIIGMGYVGASVAISCLTAGVADELLVNDLDRELAEGEAMDLRHGAAFLPVARVRSAAVEEMRDADAVVLAAGRSGSAGQSRLELLRDNARIATDIARRLLPFAGLLVVVANPVDVLTQIVVEESGLPPERVIGTGTMLDTARLRQLLGEELGLEPRSIHAQVVGEHGDSEVVLWSTAAVGGRRLRALSEWSAAREHELSAKIRGAAHEIIARKGATNHAIGLVTAALLRWALRDEARVLTVSRVQQGAFGLTGVALSLPAVVSRAGALRVIEPELEPAEAEALERSAEVLRRARASLLAR
jgi:L-lactate dehydrogenase